MQSDQINARTMGDNFGSVTIFIVMFLLGLFLVFNSIFIPEGKEGFALTMVVSGIVILILADIYFLVILFRIWRFAITESRRLGLLPSIKTPGRAVGFLFIPIFSWYWGFKAFGELAKNLNSIAKAKDKNITMSEGIGMSLAILNILSIFPYIGFIALIITCILIPIFLNQAINMCKKLSLSINSADSIDYQPIE